MAYGIYYDGGAASSWTYEWVDGDPFKIELVNPGKDGGVKSLAIFDGRPIKPEFLPTQIRSTGSKKNFPDFSNNNGFLCQRNSNPLSRNSNPLPINFFRWIW